MIFRTFLLIMRKTFKIKYIRQYFKDLQLTKQNQNHHLKMGVVIEILVIALG